MCQDFFFVIKKHIFHYIFNLENNIIGKFQILETANAI